jgi:regulator of protease activity HflC (stomatin/prohibitin superfamily)
MLGIPALFFVFIAAIYLISSIKILAEYERGVIFRLGRLSLVCDLSGRVNT